MNFLEFKTEFEKLVCFTNNQVLVTHPDFNKNNLSNWQKKGYIIKLKNGYYTFPDYLNKPNYSYWFANRIYRPSYISVHSALAFYGLIPEAIVQVISVSTLKTNAYATAFGEFNYHTISPKYFFGYVQKPLNNGLHILMASPEKAILDTLYLNSFYSSAHDLEELRLDTDIFAECIDAQKFMDYAALFKNKRIYKLAVMLIEKMSEW